MRLLNFFNRVIEYGFYALFFITPLLFNPSRNFPSFELFEWNKMMFVYGATTIIVTAWLSKMLLEKKLIIQKTPFDIPLLSFLGSQILATLFSIDPHVSIFGYYSRFHGGLLSTSTYILLYYAFVSNRNSISLRTLLLYALSSGSIVATYGILEKFGVDAAMWIQDVRSRVFSTLGQPNWLAALLTILLPIATSFILRFTHNHTNKLARLKKISHNTVPFNISLSMFSVMIPLFYLCLLFTKSRSGFIGFWVGNAIFWGSLLSLYKHDFKKTIHLLLIINTTLLILNFFIQTPFSEYNRIATYQIFQKTPIVEETQVPVGDSVINIGITDSAKIRQIVWTGAIDIIKHFPLFGTGPETFAYAYYKFRPVAHNLTSEWDFLYNKAHNEFLNIGATSGLLGLITYCSLIGWVLVWSLRRLSKTHFDAKIMILALIAAYVSIHISNFFGFSVVVVGLYFFMIPTWIFSLAQPEVPKQPPVSIAGSQYLALVLPIGTAVFILYSLTIFWLTDSYYARSLAFTRAEKNTAAYSYIVTATQLRPGEPVYHDERASVASSLAAASFDAQDATSASTFAKEAISESSKALSVSPQNVNFWKTRTRIFFMLSQVAPEFNSDALEAISVASQLAPTDAKIAYNKAVILGRLHKNIEAIDTLTKTIELKPDYRDAYVALAIFYEEENQKDKARETLELALKRINPDDAEIKQRLEELK